MLVPYITPLEITESPEFSPWLEFECEVFAQGGLEEGDKRRQSRMHKMIANSMFAGVSDETTLLGWAITYELWVQQLELEGLTQQSFLKNQMRQYTEEMLIRHAEKASWYVLSRKTNAFVYWAYRLCAIFGKQNPHVEAIKEQVEVFLSRFDE